MVGTLSKKYGWEFYEKLHQNDIMIVQGHQQVSDTLKRGERLIAAEGDFAYAEADRKAGHDVLIINATDGVFAVPSPTAIIKGASNPNAAKLLASWMLSDTAQRILPEAGAYSPRIDIPPPANAAKLADLKLIEIDYEAIESQTQAIKKKFNDVFQ